MKIKKIITLFYVLVISLSINLLAQDKPQVDVGGALRFNYNLSSWKDGQIARGGDFGYDVFRINAKAAYKGVKLNAEYRQYSTGFGGGMLKQGWIGYDFTSKDNLQIGLIQVPFGNTQYNSHNWFFSLNYYVGLEDDHDMGVKYTHTGDHWLYSLAFFKNAEELNLGSYSDVSDSRYSYDVSSIDVDGDGTLDLRNKETNQVNGQLAYAFGDDLKSKLGVSAEFGGLYNLDEHAMGNHYAFAAQYKGDIRNFDLLAQVSYYKYNPVLASSDPSNEVAMTAYGAPYLIASEAATYTVGAAYSVSVKWGPISSLQFYNDFGMMQKMDASFADTYMNVTGVLVTAGNVYTYIDYAAGKNQPWLGSVWTNALASGGDTQWDARFNINIGYYF